MKKRRFEAQKLGILQKDEKLPENEYQEILKSPAKTYICIDASNLASSLSGNFSHSIHLYAWSFAQSGSKSMTTGSQPLGGSSE